MAEAESSAPPAVAPAATVAPKKKPWWRHTWAVISAVIGLVGAITGVVSILPFVFREATTLDSLTISVESVDSALAPVFAVPVTADWASFPVSKSTCDAAQQSWLEEHGEPLGERFLVSVANTAREGAMMSLKDFRGVGEVAATGPTHVAVTCDRTGGGPSNLRAAVLDLATGRTAVFQQADPSLPANPLVFNLAPGENGQFALSVRSSSAFSGAVVFVEALGVENREVELPLGIVDVPGTAAVRLGVVAGQLVCEGDPECVVADVLDALR